MKITACSIVKNEEQNIARSIESYEDAVDEIIIVDTGSSDTTVEICKSYKARILFYKWNNDFAAAKNYALEQAEGDWIIFLDADEWFEPKLDRKIITDILKQIDNIADGLMTTLCEYNPITQKVFSKEKTTRIFRNLTQICFQGRIHERLKKLDKEIIQAHCPDIEIFHSGYANELAKKKSKRNIDILYDIYKNGDASTSLYFYIFRENYILGNADEAIKFYDLFVKQEDTDQVILDSDIIISVYEIMYRIMECNRDKFLQKEIDSLLDTAYKKYSAIPMHSYMIACEKLKAKEYSIGFEWLNKALCLNKEYSQPFINSFTAFIADTYYKLGYICFEYENLEQAFTYYMEALKYAESKDLASILTGIIKIIKDQPEEEIILFLNKLLDVKKKDFVEAILCALKYTRLHKAFLYYAIKYNQEFNGQDDTTYIAMMLTGKAELAAETAVKASISAEKDISTKVSETGNRTWHLDYAAIAIIYCNSAELYNRYKELFCDKKRQIIESYLEYKKMENITDELKREHEKMLNHLSFILAQEDINRFKAIL